MLKLSGPKAAEEDLAHEFSEENDEDEGLNIDHGHTERESDQLSKNCTRTLSKYQIFYV